MLALVLALLPTASASDKPPYDKHVSITFSPLHLITATGEVTAEGRVLDKLGLAGIVGVGAPSGYTLVEVGASGRYYVVGDFDHGMQLGAEMLYITDSDSGFIPLLNLNLGWSF